MVHAPEHVAALHLAVRAVLQQLLVVPARQAQRRPVHAHHVRPGITDEHGDGRRLEDRRQVGLLSPERLLCSHTARDVAPVADEDVGGFEVVGRDIEDEAVAVGLPPVHAELDRALRDRPAPGLLPRLLRHPVVEVPDHLADEVAALAREHPAGVVVDVDHGPVGGDHGDGQRGVVDGEQRQARRLRRLAVGAPQVGAADGGPHRRRQARQVVLEHVVHGPGRHGGHGGVLVDGARHGDGRQVGRQLRDEAQGLDAREPGDVVVDESDLPGLVGERLRQAVLGLHPVPLRLEARLAQTAQLQLDVVLAVFDEQDADAHAHSLRPLSPLRAKHTPGES